MREGKILMKVVLADRDNIAQAEMISAVAFFGQTEFHLGGEQFERAYEKKQDSAWGRTYLAVDDAGNAVSTIACNDYTVNFDGNDVPMSGIGNVATCPHRRRQGGVRACFARALADMAEQGQYLSALHPFSNSYYQKFGYASVSPVVKYRMPTRHMPAVDAGSFHLFERGSDPQELRAVWNRFAARYNLMSVRSDAEMKQYREYDPYHSDRQLYIYYGPGGEPKAYAAFKKTAYNGRPSIEIPPEDLAFADAQGLRGILSIAGRFSATYEYVTFELPQEFPLELCLPEIVLDYPAMEKRYCGMARVTAVEPILKMAACRGSGRAVIEIEDKMLPHNSGRFAVRFTDGKCIAVERTEREPDLCLSIGDFTALILGMYDLDAYLDARGLTVKNNALYGVFYRKGCLLRDFF